MDDMAKQAAEIIEKQSAHITTLTTERNQFKRAFDIAVSKLAQHEHREDCRKLATQMASKGQISHEEIDIKVEELFEMKVADIAGIRNAVGLMNAPVSQWGTLEGDPPVNGNGNVRNEEPIKSSADHLEGLVDWLKTQQ